MNKKIKKLIVGNWKMNPLTSSEAKKIGSSIKRGIIKVRKTEAVLCPPYIYMDSMKSLPGKNIHLGAQDSFSEISGSFTGQISPEQLKNIGVGYVILGHSEKRALGDTDETVNRKIIKAINSDLKVIICIGEDVRDVNGEYLSLIKKQLISALRDTSKKNIDNLVIAYEPVWAIGKEKAVEPQEIHEISIFIRKVLREIYGILGDDIRIIYGGSVTLNNAKSIIQDGFVHGLLIGRESLNHKNFVELIKDVDTI